MTRLIVDPGILETLRGSKETPIKVRLIVQIVESRLGELVAARVPNVELQCIVLDGPDNSTVLLRTGTLDFPAECAMVGAVVSVWGFYNGDFVDAFECRPFGEVTKDTARLLEQVAGS